MWFLFRQHRLSVEASVMHYLVRFPNHYLGNPIVTMHRSGEFDTWQCIAMDWMGWMEVTNDEGGGRLRLLHPSVGAVPRAIAQLCKLRIVKIL